MRAVMPSLMLLGLTLFVYRDLPAHGWNYEDAALHRRAPLISAQTLLRPSRWLIQATWSDDPRAVHLGSLALHLVNGALVGLLAWQLGIGRWWLPMGIVWLHPLNVEAVAYGAARGELLSALGILIAVNAALWKGHSR